MKALVVYDVAGTVTTKTIEGPYIRCQLFRDGRLSVTVFATERGEKVRAFFAQTAYEVDLDRT